MAKLLGVQRVVEVIAESVQERHDKLTSTIISELQAVNPVGKTGNSRRGWRIAAATTAGTIGLGIVSGTKDRAGIDAYKKSNVFNVTEYTDVGEDWDLNHGRSDQAPAGYVEDAVFKAVTSVR